MSFVRRKHLSDEGGKKEAAPAGQLLQEAKGLQDVRVEIQTRIRSRRRGSGLVGALVPLWFPPRQPIKRHAVIICHARKELKRGKALSLEIALNRGAVVAGGVCEPLDGPVPAAHEGREAPGDFRERDYGHFCLTL